MSVLRVDVIFDEYRQNSLKNATRLKRGRGVRGRVEETKVIPRNWTEFLRDEGNKAELFQFIAHVMSSETFNAKVVVKNQENVFPSTLRNTHHLMPCSHEEADTRMLLHAADGAMEGCRRVVIRRVDTDVVVIATALYCNFSKCKKLRVAFGVGQMYRYIDISALSETLGPERCDGLLAFHSMHDRMRYHVRF